MEVHLHNNKKQKSIQLCFPFKQLNSARAFFLKMKVTEQNKCSPEDANMKHRQKHYREKGQV